MQIWLLQVNPMEKLSKIYSSWHTLTNQPKLNSIILFLKNQKLIPILCFLTERLKNRYEPAPDTYIIGYFENSLLDPTSRWNMMRPSTPCPPVHEDTYIFGLFAIFFRGYLLAPKDQSQNSEICIYSEFFIIFWITLLLGRAK